MAVPIAEVRAGLAAMLEAVPEVHIYPEMPDSPVAPALAIRLVSSITYATGQQPYDVILIPVACLVSRPDAIRGQRALDELVAGVEDALLGPEPSSPIERLSLVETTNYRVEQPGSASYMTADVRVEVWTCR
jgi:hypothetical protein